LTCRSSVAFREQKQFSSKIRGSTIRADNNLRKYPRDELANILPSEKMDAHLRPEFLLVD
jgi:hypothetical protein